MRFVATTGQDREAVEVTGGDGRYRVLIGDRTWEVDARLAAPGIWSLLVEGRSEVAAVDVREGAWAVEVGGEIYTVEVEEETRHILRRRGGVAAGAGGQTVKAPMPGRITHVSVATGDAVAAGETVVVIEAMKMENELRVTAPGTVREIRVQAGQAVNAGDVLMVIG